MLLQNSHENETNIFERLGKVEQELAASQTDRANISRRIDEICAEREKEKDREQGRNNMKIALVALAVTIINIVIGIGLRLLGVE
jgi:putative Mn2+ efflux pump MntP